MKQGFSGEEAFGPLPIFAIARKNRKNRFVFFTQKIDSLFLHKKRLTFLIKKRIDFYRKYNESLLLWTSVIFLDSCHSFKKRSVNFGEKMSIVSRKMEKRFVFFLDFWTAVNFKILAFLTIANENNDSIFCIKINSIFYLKS